MNSSLANGRICRLLITVVMTSTLVSPGHAKDEEKPGMNFVVRTGPENSVQLAAREKGPWKAVKEGDIYEGYTVQACSPAGWVALEKDNERYGEIVYVLPDNTSPLRVRKLLGKVGSQVPPEIPEKSDEYWKTIYSSEKDILGEKYLSDSRDPSLERTKNLLTPVEFPHGYVGTLMDDPGKLVLGSPHEVAIAWDGSVGLDRGFFTGREPLIPRQFSPALPFALNGKEVSRDESLKGMFRKQLDFYLPITQFVYQRKDENVGWEQIVMMSRYEGKPVLMVRFRLRNLAPRPQKVTLSVNPPSRGEFTVNKDNVHIAVPYDIIEPRQTKRKEVLHKTPAVSHSSLYADREFAIKEKRPVWTMSLPAGDSGDIYFYLPGHDDDGPLVIPPGQIKTAFFTALKREKENWEIALGKCTQFKIPEPDLNDIHKVILAKLLITNDGVKLRGGAVNYEGFWPYNAIESCMVMLEFGLIDEAKYHLKYFMKNRILPSGMFRFDYRAWRHQIYDAGYLMRFLANYYWYTKDGTLFEEYQKQLDLLLGYIETNRQMSREEYPETDPRHGMLLASMNNDTKKPSYFYSSDAPVAMGISYYAEALKHYGTVQGNNVLAKKGDELMKYAEDYYALLRKSIETCGAIEKQGDKITYIHHIPLPPETPKPFLGSPYRKVGSTDRAYARFHEFPRLAETGLLNERELRALFEYEFNHEYTVLGMKRFVRERLDDFRTYHVAVQRLRLGMRREYLMHYYAFLNYIIIPDLWIGIEQTELILREGRKGRNIGRTGAKGIFRGEDFIQGSRIQGWDGIHGLRPVPSETKYIFAFDEPDGGAVWIARAIPDHWLTGGEEVGAKGLTTRYGILDLSMRYSKEKRVLDVVISPRGKDVFPELRIGVRDPEGGKASSVEFVGSPDIKYSLKQDQDLVYVQDVNGRIHMKVRLEK